MPALMESRAQRRLASLLSFAVALAASTPSLADTPTRTLQKLLPAGSDSFGSSVAVVGSLIVVGVPNDDTSAANAGAAYVFDAATGSLLRTLLSPSADSGDHFGSAVAAVGSNVIIGAPDDDTGAGNAGSAYLFDAMTGALLRTFANPTPQSNDRFGVAVAALGANPVVAAPNDNTGATNAGAAYLLDASSGALLRTFQRPVPSSGDLFGSTLAALGTNLLVGVPRDDTGATDAGAVLLLDGSTGGLVRTFANPTPGGSDEFGSALGTIGSNVLVGAPLDDTTAGNAGSVYLLDGSTGALLRTFQAPSPASGDNFGSAVAGVGASVLVGAPSRNDGASDTGIAYLFDVASGGVLRTLTKTTPASFDHLGAAVAGVGSTLVVSAPDDNLGAADAGVVYLFAGPECGDGVLDLTEQCDDGNTIAGDCCTPLCLFEAAGSACRAAAGVCDLVETCSGSSGVCPSDAKSTAECRATAGTCDVPESCDGSSNDCPSDANLPSTTVCRPSAGACDLAELCTGSAPACPVDTFRASSFECRASAGVCDIAELCTGSAAACPTDGKSVAECRATAGICDLAESCDGVLDDCPADIFKASTALCRASAGACDPAERCTGTSEACPNDAKSTSVCRPVGGDCDIAETCDGVSNGCPSDVLIPSGTQCRAAVDACDIAESCTGSAPACGVDAHYPDDDNDGLCNPLDICTDGRTLDRARVTIGRLSTPPGDDTFSLRGDILFSLPQISAIDPIANGLRVVLYDDSLTSVVDATIPGGVYDLGTRTGWRVGGSLTFWSSPVGISGIVKIKIRIRPTAPGLLKLQITGKRSNFTVAPNEIPVSTVVVFDPPLGESGQCAQASFAGPPPAPYCVFSGTGSTLRCH